LITTNDNESFFPLGQHPLPPHPCGVHFDATDIKTEHAVWHRVLDDGPLQTVEFTSAMKQWIVNHHVSPETIERDRVRREALERQGFVYPLPRFPINLSTQKGNWAEILLAEYVMASCSANLPVYRLRYNPNVDQSMKGRGHRIVRYADDILILRCSKSAAENALEQASRYLEGELLLAVNREKTHVYQSRNAAIPVALYALFNKQLHQ